MHLVNNQAVLKTTNIYGGPFSLLSLPLYCKMPPETWRNKLFLLVFIDFGIAMLSFPIQEKASNPLFF